MTNHANPNVQADLADGTITEVLGILTLDGVSGWTKVVAFGGQVWAYAPVHYVNETGEIARQIS